MSKTAIIFWTGTGNTEQMANAVYEGAKEAGEAELFNVSDISVQDAKSYDNLILGCPAMGAEELEEGEFEPFFSQLEGDLSGKEVGLFGSYGWGDGEWMRLWEERVKAAGARLVCDSVIVNEAPDDEGVNQCKALGKTVAGK